MIGARTFGFGVIAAGAGASSIINVDSIGVEIAEAVNSQIVPIFIINVDSIGVEVAEAVNGVF